MDRCNSYTLSESLDLYFSHSDISKKKYYNSYLITARFVWKEIFKKTLWVVKSQWQTMQEGDPFPYINIPSDAERVFSVSVQDDCHRLVPLFYNNRINVVSRPTKKKCGCTDCDCGGLCCDANGLTVTTKLLFTINGIEYFQKTWTEVCKNGDVLLWNEIPTKKYNNLTGDAGDFNDDYNNDYSHSSAPFSDYTIVTVKTQEKICSLEVLPCGCVKDTPENFDTFNTFCGCFSPCTKHKRKHCDDFLNNPNNNERGEVKMSPCGTKMYYQHSKHWKHTGQKKNPDFLLISYQSNGEDIDQQVLVPEFALKCLHDGIDYYKKARKDKYSYNEKMAAKWQYEAERSEVILFLNPIDLEELAHTQNAVIKW